MQLPLVAGQPMLFDKGKKGIIMRSNRLAVGVIGEEGVTEEDVLIHNPSDPDPSMAFWLSRFEPPEFPVAVGVLRAVERPTYDEGIQAQIGIAKDRSGPGDLKEMLYGADTWVVD